MKRTSRTSAPRIPHLPTPWIDDSAARPSRLPTPRNPRRLPNRGNSNPVIHTGVICDACSRGVVGVRNKCLDCPGMKIVASQLRAFTHGYIDYDLCTSCIDSGHAQRHNSQHQFLAINEPGRVIVHTVHTNEGEQQMHPVSTPAAHNASCNMCESRISGDRYVRNKHDNPSPFANRRSEMSRLP
jgi:hypothetical protein